MAKKRVSKKESPAKKVKWRTALVLSILLGMFGVDRFYMGNHAEGILKLFITIISLGLLFWIWWIIDIILIAKKYPFPSVNWID